MTKSNKCPECKQIGYTHNCQYCNENRFLPKEIGE
jgi:hypothetical protein